MNDSMQFEAEPIATSRQMAETLKAMANETSTAEYTDKFSGSLSPHSCGLYGQCRQALKELHPIKCSQETKCTSMATRAVSCSMS